jgi:hypothetical protein
LNTPLKFVQILAVHPVEPLLFVQPDFAALQLSFVYLPVPNKIPSQVVTKEAA